MTQLTIDQAMKLAIENHHAGKLAAAEDIYRRVLSQQPNHPDALHMLGVIAQQCGRLDAAVDLIRRAIAINPAVADYYNNLGAALCAGRHFDEAAATLRQAILLKPDAADAHYNLGNALGESGRFDEAISALRRATQLRPGYAEAFNNLGNLLRENGDLESAAAALKHAAHLKPDFAEAHNNLGNVYRDTGLLEDAIAAHTLALRLKPDYAEASNNLGNALTESGRFEEAKNHLRQAICLKPDFAEAHFNLANIYLLQGDFERGWPAYEWRSRCAIPRTKRREFVQPQWDGSPLNGRTILLHAEQGFGDTIQLARFVTSAPLTAGKIIIECQPELIRLLQPLPGVQQVVAKDHPLPHFDVHCPMFSLPLVSKATLESMPASVPYLKADKTLAAKWSVRLRQFNRPNVGIVWAGNPSHKNDRNRSLSLTQLAPLFAVNDITFHSLQKGEAARQFSSAPWGMTLIDHSAELSDFAETAALIANLDLVIAADTAVAHLAGALAKPVWVLLPYIPDWRWLLDRQDSPWYPTMRLFRQKTFRDWAVAVERVTVALEAWKSQGNRR